MWLTAVSWALWVSWAAADPDILLVREANIALPIDNHLRLCSKGQCHRTGRPHPRLGRHRFSAPNMRCSHTRKRATMRRASSWLHGNHSPDLATMLQRQELLLRRPRSRSPGSPGSEVDALITTRLTPSHPARHKRSRLWSASATSAAGRSQSLPLRSSTIRRLSRPPLQAPHGACHLGRCPQQRISGQSRRQRSSRTPLHLTPWR